MAALMTLPVLPELLAQEFIFRYPYVAGSSADHYGGKYGWSIAANADRIVVGSPFANEDRGEVRVYPTSLFLIYDDVVPQVLAETLAPETTRKFGAAVALDGPFIAVGNCSAQGGSEYCGINSPWVSIFREQDGAWVQAQRIIRPAHATGRFGVAIALSGDWLAIGGASKATAEGPTSMVYLYRREGDAFNTFPSDSVAGAPGSDAASDDFGHALAMDPDHLIIGAPTDDELGTDAGAAYIYANNGSGVSYGDQVRKLLPSDGDAHDRAGFSVALRGRTCVIGAPEKDADGTPTGAAYVFDRDEGFNGNWGQVAVLSSHPAEDPGPWPDMQFGASVAIAADRIAVGAPQDSLGTPLLQGSVAVHAMQGGEWVHIQAIRPRSDGPVNDVSRSGTAVAFAHESLLIGAPWAIVDSGSTFPTGGVLLYADPLLASPGSAPSSGQLWPVPATDHLFFSLGTPEPAQVRVVLRDATGRTVMDRRLPNGPVPTRVDLGAGPTGLYSLEVIVPGSGRTYRTLFIRQ